ncbi:MAG: dienelactone hydrolase family protein [Planctomycetota bacterium]
MRFTLHLRPSVSPAAFGCLLVLSALGPRLASAEEAEGISAASLAYVHDGVTLEAYIARPAEVDGPTPGVLIAHAWWGQGEYARHRARMLADLGYIAVVLDMYGRDVYTDDPNVASGLAGAFYNDREAFRARAMAGYDMLLQQADVDPDRLAAIGYCFGGTTVLELAYAGADLVGIVPFHGNLLPPASPDDAANVTSRVLIAHGGDDPFYPNHEMLGVYERLQEAGVDVTAVVYSGAQHAFTDPGATGELQGALYDEDADRRSWTHMRLFFDQVFSE